MADTKKQRDGGAGGSEDLWLDGAHALLVEHGVDAVKILPLAKRLGVSRTSFYWHFTDRDALLQALIGRWRRKNTENLVAQAERYAETICEAIFNVFDCWLDDRLFDARLDFAIRSWAQGAPELQSVVDAADTRRIAALTAMFARFGYSDAEARTRGRTAYYTQIGYISLRVAETMDARLVAMPAYCEIYAGAAPTEAEIARLRSRHEARLDAA